MPKVEKKIKYVAIDTETTGLDYWNKDYPFMVALYGDGVFEVHEWQIDPLTRKPLPIPCETLKRIRRFTEDESIIKVFFNAKYDILMLKKIGIEVRGCIEEVSFMARICNNIELSYKLKTLARNWLNMPNDDEVTLKKTVTSLRRIAKKLGWAIGSSVEEDYWLCAYWKELGASEEVANTCREYCLGDVVRTIGLFNFYTQILAKDEGGYYRKSYEFELELLPTVIEMEQTGMHISKAKTLVERAHVQEIADTHLQKIRDKVKNQEFNPSSSQQLASVMFGPSGVKCAHGVCQGITSYKRTKGGAPSTDWEALNPLRGDPFVDDVLSHRSAEHAIALFFDKYLDLAIKCGCGCGKYLLRPGLNQCGAATGRFSCSSPNLQQVSDPESSAKQITEAYARKPFGPPKGYLWYSFDYAQMETRVFAELANVRLMLEALYAGEDVNTAITNQAWGGKGNPHAIQAAIQSLELDKSLPESEDVLKSWYGLGWMNTVGWPELLEKDDVADCWLSKFNYDIVAAEKSIGKKASRTRGKNVNYAIMFGGGIHAITKFLFCTDSEAHAFRSAYLRKFPEAQVYTQQLIREIKLRGFAINCFGRKYTVDPAMPYKAVNYSIQGPCADLLKQAMLRNDRMLKSSGFDARLVIPIHDEIIVQIKEGHDSVDLLKKIKMNMEYTGGALKVPMITECARIKESWQDKEKVAL